MRELQHIDPQGAPHWLKAKNPESPAARREALEATPVSASKH